MLSNNPSAIANQQRYNLLMQAQSNMLSPLFGIRLLGNTNTNESKKNAGSLDYDFYIYIESCKSKLERDYAL